MKEKETLAQLAQRFEVSQEIVSRWKGEFVKLSTGEFDNKYINNDGVPTEEVKILRAKVGELTIERD